jgi:hypothetical protein
MAATAKKWPISATMAKITERTNTICVGALRHVYLQSVTPRHDLNQIAQGI